MKQFKNLVLFMLIFTMTFTSLGLNFMNPTIVYAQDNILQKNALLEDSQDDNTKDIKKQPILSLEEKTVKAGETVTATVYAPSNPNTDFKLSLWDLNKGNYYETNKKEKVQVADATDNQGRAKVNLGVPQEVSAGKYQLELKLDKDDIDKIYTDLTIEEVVNSNIQLNAAGQRAIISTDLEKWGEYAGPKMEFQVTVENGATDEEGNLIKPVVKVCGKEVPANDIKPISGKDGVYGVSFWQTMFTANPGINEIVVEAKGTDNRNRKESIEIIWHGQFGIPTPTNHVIFMIERFTIGHGYYLEPMEVGIYNFDTVATVMIRALRYSKSEKMKDLVKHTGSLADGSSFYVAQLYDPNMRGKEISPPQYIMDKISEKELPFKENDDDWLGEFDYNHMSGWVFSVNDKGIPASAGSISVKSNDVIRMMFTLHGYGADVGCGLEGENYRVFPPLSDLFRKVYELKNHDTLKDKESVIIACNNALEYLKGNEQTEEGVAEQFKLLEDAVSNIHSQLPTDENGNYLISTAEDMRSFQYHVSNGELYENKTILLTQNIDLGCNKENPWISIEEFNGTFDGQGHKITGLYAEDTGYGNHAALFKKLNKTGTICNLGVEGNIKVENHARGAMIASIAAGKIENCYAKGEISSSTVLSAGGISYEAKDSTKRDSNGTIHNCFSDVNFKYTGAGDPANSFVGGIAFYAPNMANCYYIGTADEKLPEFYPISHPLYNENVHDNTLFYDKDRSELKSKNIVGTPKGISKTSEEMKQESTYTGFNFTNVWGINENINGGYPYLRVLEEEKPEKPIEVELDVKIKDKLFDRTTNAEVESIELIGVVEEDDVSLEYTLESAKFKTSEVGNDIEVDVIISSPLLKGKDKDKYALPVQLKFKVLGNILPSVTELPYNEELEAYTISSLDEFKLFADETNNWNDFKGEKVILLQDIDLKGSSENPWLQPISADSKAPFLGVFDGNGKKIKNLYLKVIDKDQDGKVDYSNPSLFGNVGSDGVIRNVEFSDIKIDVSCDIYITSSIAVFSTNSGIISNCKFTGEAKNIDELGEYNVGVAGVTSSNYGTIVNCLVDMDIDIASNRNRDVSGIAWLMGANENSVGKIENCVIIGNMKQNTNRNDGAVSVFPVTPIEEGNVSRHIIDNVYYSNENCQPYFEKTGNRVQVGTNLSLNDLKDKTKLTGLDFARYWGISPNVNNGFPYLKLFEEGTQPLIELGLDIKVKDKAFDNTLDGEIEEVTLTNVLPDDKDKLTIDYDVKSVKFDNKNIGKDKIVTVVFNSVTLGDADGVTANKYNLSIKNFYTVRAEIYKAEVDAPSQEELIEQINNYLSIYYQHKSAYYKDTGSLLDQKLESFEFDPAMYQEWGFIDCGINDNYVKFTEEQKENLRHNWEKYLEGLRKYLETNTVPNNDFNSNTYNKILLAMTAMGYEPSDFKELDVIEEISKKDFGMDGMIMGRSYGNIAMDSGGYDYKKGPNYRNREEIVRMFDKEPVQLSPGTPISDFWTMDVQQYIPYYNPNAKEGDPEYKIKIYFDNVIEQLSIAQQSDGKFGNEWTTDQVVILLSGLGVDLTTDPRFIKNGHTALEVIFSTLNTETGQIRGTMENQHAEALMSVLKVIDGRQNSIFVMDHIVSDRAKEVIAAIDALPSVITPNDKATVKEVRARYDELRSMEKKHITNYKKLLAAEGIEESPLRDRVEAAIKGAAQMAPQKHNSMDWVVVGLARSGNQDLIPDDYLLDVEDYLIENNGEFEKPTEYERMVLGILAAGGDPTDIGGYNLIEKISNADLKGQGINALAFGLIALDSKNYEVAKDVRWDRDKLIEAILEEECSNQDTEYGQKAGWAWGINKADTDMTGMVMTALAPYNNDNYPEVKGAIERAVDWLKYVQHDDGGFSTWEDKTSESCAQVIMGLCTNNVDPAGEDFTKNGKNAIDALLSFEVENHGGFAHMIDKNDGTLRFNGMANEQALYALSQYLYYLDDKGSIYDWTKEDDALDIMVDGIEDGQVVKESEISFKVKANEVAKVTLNGEELNLSDGKYVANLKEGKNKIIITANNQKLEYTVFYLVKQIEIQETNAKPFKKGEKAELKINTTNISQSKKEVSLIIALYEKSNNKLVDYNYISGVLNVGETQELNTEVLIPEVGDYLVKGFVWDNIDDMNVLSVPVVIEVK